MDFFGADDKFASSVQKTITTRKTVLVRPAPRRETSRIRLTEHVPPAMSRTKTGSRSGTPQGTPNKRRKVVVEEPERKRAKTIKTPRRATSPLSSSSEDEPLPPRLDVSPPEDEPQQILTDSSPITRQVFRPTLIHSETIPQRNSGEKYKGFIPSTEIVKSSLAKYRPCNSAAALLFR